MSRQASDISGMGSSSSHLHPQSYIHTRSPARVDDSNSINYDDESMDGISSILSPYPHTYSKAVSLMNPDSITLNEIERQEERQPSIPASSPRSDETQTLQPLQSHLQIQIHSQPHTQTQQHSSPIPSGMNRSISENEYDQMNPIENSYDRSNAVEHIYSSSEPSLYYNEAGHRIRHSDDESTHNTQQHEEHDNIHVTTNNTPDYGATNTAYSLVGNRDIEGEKMARVLQQELGSDRVFDLAKGDPIKDLERHLHTHNLRIVVGGGDGTVNWILTCIGSLPFHPFPPVGIIPLGTGNDTARAFGWGYKFVGKKKIIRNLHRMAVAPIVPFDRWHATIYHQQPLTAEQIKGLPLSIHEMKEEPQFLGYKPPKQDKKDPEYRAVVGADHRTGEAQIAKESHHAPPPRTSSSTSPEPHRQPIPIPASSQEEEHKHKSSNNNQSVADQGHGPYIPPLPSLHSSHSLPTPLHPLQSVNHHDNNIHHDHHNTTNVLYREAQFNNYLSFGIDAQIQYRFHDHREAHHSLYSSRIGNMGWMTVFGAINCCTCSAQPLLIKVEVPHIETGEWREIHLPKNVSSLVLLNGTTYAGGRNIWGTSKSKKNEYHGPPPSYNDGLLELMATENTFHLTMMLIKVRRAIRIAQVHECRITTLGPIHAQLDGEPWLQTASTYHIRRIHQALMLDGKEYKKKKSSRPSSPRATASS